MFSALHGIFNLDRAKYLIHYGSAEQLKSISCVSVAAHFLHLHYHTAVAPSPPTSSCSPAVSPLPPRTLPLFCLRGIVRAESGALSCRISSKISPFPLGGRTYVSCLVVSCLDL